MEETYLFHFTNKDALYGILKETFKPSYALEHFHSMLIGYDTEAGVPIVSFSEMEMSALEHFKYPYGRYGLCMKKEWAQRMHLCPVLYMDINSECLASFVEGIHLLFEKCNHPSTTDMRLFKANNDVMNILRYTKPYEDVLVRKGKIIDKNYRFACEREWRYAVPMEKVDGNAFVTKAALLKDNKRTWNKKIEKYTLGYSVDDIEFLIVPSKADIKPLKDYVEHLGMYNSEEIAKLNGKIRTVNQLSKRGICDRLIVFFKCKK
jgi:hypothetical protein